MIKKQELETPTSAGLREKAKRTGRLGSAYMLTGIGAAVAGGAAHIFGGMPIWTIFMGAATTTGFVAATVFSIMPKEQKLLAQADALEKQETADNKKSSDNATVKNTPQAALSDDQRRTAIEKLSDAAQKTDKLGTFLTLGAIAAGAVLSLGYFSLASSVGWGIALVAAPVALFTASYLTHKKAYKMNRQAAELTTAENKPEKTKKIPPASPAPALSPPQPPAIVNAAPAPETMPQPAPETAAPAPDLDIGINLLRDAKRNFAAASAEYHAKKEAEESAKLKAALLEKIDETLKNSIAKLEHGITEEAAKVKDGVIRSSASGAPLETVSVFTSGDKLGTSSITAKNGQITVRARDKTGGTSRDAATAKAVLSYDEIRALDGFQQVQDFARRLDIDIQIKFGVEIIDSAKSTALCQIVKPVSRELYECLQTSSGGEITGLVLEANIEKKFNGARYPEKTLPDAPSHAKLKNG